MTFNQIESIEEIEEISDVYDIEVENNHNFFANGILVHNCLAGPMSWETLRVCQEVEFDKMNASILNDKSLLDQAVKQVGLVHERLVDSFGEENAYLEIQFNRLGAQDLVNRSVIEYARRNGLTKQLIVTCDSHYPRPEDWLVREVYKKLGWMKYQTFTPDMLPKSRDELKCELYPKNAQQIWDEYKKAKELPSNDWYDDQEVFDAIERTHDIAHHVIGDVKLDRTPRYPSKIVPADTTAFKMLVKLSMDGLRKKGFDKNQEYVDRLKYELDIIKRMGNAAYFVTLSKMMNLARDVVLCGVARGSGGGSLVCFLTGITDLDSIKYKCRFDRFLNLHRCLKPETNVLCENKELKQIKNLNVGDKIIGGSGKVCTILNRFETIVDEVVKITIGGNVITCSRNHQWPIIRDGKEMLVTAEKLLENDEISHINLPSL